MQNICKTFEIPNTNFKTDIRYEKAAKRWIEVPVLKCPEVMKISGFTDEETKDNTIAQCVRWMKKTIEEQIVRGVIPPIVQANNKPKDQSVSPLTEDTAALTSKKKSSSTSSSNPLSTKEHQKILGVKKIWKTSIQAQQHRVNTKKINDNKKKAFKQATILYSEEKKRQRNERKEVRRPDQRTVWIQRHPR